MLEAVGYYHYFLATKYYKKYAKDIDDLMLLRVQSLITSQFNDPAQQRSSYSPSLAKRGLAEIVQINPTSIPFSKEEVFLPDSKFVVGCR